MPIYEYQCEACDHKMEKIQKMSDDPLKDCPACNQPKLRKLVSAVAFRLKGKGWYETDFKTGNKKNIAGGGSDSSGSSSSASGDGKKTESKSKKSDAGNSSKSSTS